MGLKESHVRLRRYVKRGPGRRYFIHILGPLRSYRACFTAAGDDGRGAGGGLVVHTRPASRAYCTDVAS
jgi:hypothetical protein